MTQLPRVQNGQAEQHGGDIAPLLAVNGSSHGLRGWRKRGASWTPSGVNWMHHAAGRTPNLPHGRCSRCRRGRQRQRNCCWAEDPADFSRDRLRPPVNHVVDFEDLWLSLPLRPSARLIQPACICATKQGADQPARRTPGCRIFSSRLRRTVPASAGSRTCFRSFNDGRNDLHLIPTTSGVSVSSQADPRRQAIAAEFVAHAPVSCVGLEHFTSGLSHAARMIKSSISSEQGGDGCRSSIQPPLPPDAQADLNAERVTCNCSSCLIGCWRCAPAAYGLQCRPTTAKSPGLSGTSAARFHSCSNCSDFQARLYGPRRNPKPWPGWCTLLAKLQPT